MFGGCLMGNVYPAAFDVVDSRNCGFAIGVANLLGGFAGGPATFLTGLWKASLGIVPLMTAAAVFSGEAAVMLLGVFRLWFRVAAPVTDSAT